MKKIICILAVMLLLTGCAAGDGVGIGSLQSNSPTPEVVEMTSVTPEPTATPVPTPTPTEVPTPTPRLFGRLSSLTLMEAIDELVSYGADISDVVEYDEASYNFV